MPRVNGKMPPQNRLGWEYKSTPKAVCKPTTRNLERAAGFYEGEGSCCYTGTTHELQIYQVNKEPVEWMQQWFGGSLRIKGGKRWPNEQPVWVWRVCGSRARGVAMTLYSLLSRYRQGQMRKIGIVGSKTPNAEKKHA